MKSIFVGNLSPDASEQSVTDMFAQFGTVRSVRLVADVFTGKCRGFGFIGMEGHEARAAIAGLDGKTVDGNALRVRFEEPGKSGSRGRR